MRTLIIIPAYNEELTIGSVVALAKKYGDVLVVDDGSTDRTSEIAKEAGAVVIRHEVNRGKGAALRTGFKYALAGDYDVVVTIDADGQHNPDEIPRLVNPIVTGKADLVIGSRYLGGASKKVPLYRRLGLWVLNKGTKLAADTEVDSQSGFRAIRVTALGKLNLNSDDYSAETDMIVKAREAGLVIKEVPISVRYDVPNKHKRNPLSHGLSLLAAILGLIGYRRPMLFFGILSLLSFGVAAVLGYWGFRPYQQTGHVVLTQTIGAGIFVIIGIQFFVSGLMLNVLAKMVRE
ncbi:glycosyl hydrolase [Thermococcus profundus]|uniref:Glycosyl hydrolase n=1 Tax=Thermococcus profundus TaxID=49899 RepID=A0A2Z2MI51_THEPR|nr:glycosyltransferase family 2 protein [Thermococcus profundus]ASJ03594.1 glycosyl hydrolase [Thermococcus profundus]